MILKLSNSDKVALIDEKDAHLNIHDWRLSSHNYVRATINKKRYYLHRYIMKPTSDKQVDHIDWDTLNNLRSNLRICTQRDNRRNSRPKKTKLYSKFKGVSFCSTEKSVKRWVAACEINNKRITIGRYLTEEEAKLAYNKKAEELFGEFARLNK